MDIARGSSSLVSLWTRRFLPPDLPKKLLDFWFRVDGYDLSRVPSTGGVLLVANHSGLLPLDAAVTLNALQHHRSAEEKIIGFLGQTHSSSLPRRFFPDLDLRVGGPAEALEELKNNKAVLVFPEGAAASQQTIWNSRTLQFFGRGGFIRIALQAKVPIVPIRIDGGEKAFPVLAQFPSVARWLGLPAFPVTPLFPLLGPLGLIPLPSRWTVRVGQPIDLSHLPANVANDDRILEEIIEDIRQRLEILAQAPRNG